MRVLVGITGGIAAYKAVSLLRLLTEAGHQVQVLPTPNALRFVGAATLEAISHSAIDPDIYTQIDQVKHIKVAQESDLIVIAPATASFLARYANGLADDLLLNVLLATKARVVVAPAMHTEMWFHPATQENILTLRARGVDILEPGIGRLTGKDSGVGRMMEPEEIFQRLFHTHSQTLSGKHFVIAAGGTQEPIDDVRFIGNRSSGKQGIALAEEAISRGARVSFISCNISEPLPTQAEISCASTSSELATLLENLLPSTDVLIMPVAVSDFTVSSSSGGKISRVDSDSIALQLSQTNDILAGLAATNKRQGNGAILVGFAAEVVSTHQELLERGKEKLNRKDVDMIVANDVSNGRTFGQADTEVILINRDGFQDVIGTKREVSAKILDSVEVLLGSKDVG
ncbi:MAG: bifunctional phosphopantothenoylcysteine decarboxylase/phosphopantothenate--cysteine ligase CoaBC [Rhodoluna sp.]